MLRIPDWLSFEIQRRWEQMALRTWINSNPRLMIGVAAASVLLFLVIVIRQLMPGPARNVEEYEKGWFYDINKGELFAEKAELAGPIEAPSGPLPNGKPAGVKAYVFSYAREPNESNRFIGFLEMPDPNAEEKSESVKPGTGGAEQWGRGKLIRRVKDKKWYPANSKGGQTILNEMLRPDESGQRPRYYPPPQ